jgi:hypothetical protein
LRRRRVRSLLLRCFVGVRPRKEERAEGFAADAKFPEEALGLWRMKNNAAGSRSEQSLGWWIGTSYTKRGWNGDRCRCNCDSFRTLVARGGISAICPQEPSIGIRPVVAQARRKLALPTGTNWGGPSCYRAASRIALTCWTDGFAGAREIGERRRRSVLARIGARSDPLRAAASMIGARCTVVNASGMTTRPPPWLATEGDDGRFDFYSTSLTWNACLPS